MIAIIIVRLGVIKPLNIVSTDISKLMRTIEDVQEDLSIRLYVHGKDEIGTVTRGFNTLLEKFNNIIQTISLHK